MSQKVYILYNSLTEGIATQIQEQTGGELFYSEDLKITETNLHDISKMCSSDFFYIIRSDKLISLVNLDLSFEPEPWDRDYVHVWNNDYQILLFNTDQVMMNPKNYTDTALEAGTIQIKSKAGRLHMPPQFDIIFLSYDEFYADENYNKLKERFPRAKRVQKIKGIFEAHSKAAELAKHNKSHMFYVVDADAQILPTFNFDYCPSAYDIESVHVWHARNPINDLEYGYGGVKLFPTKKLVSYTGSPIDFTTTVSSSFKVMEEVSNITAFNSDPFSAWRSGFRECAKLASKLIRNQNNIETEQRLEIWCSKGEDREFGDFAIMGAKEGRDFGKLYSEQPEMLGLINDFDWLERKFNS